MIVNGEVVLGNGSLRPDSQTPSFSALENYYTLEIVAGSAQEHNIIQRMFKDQDAISTVRLLQLAQARATNGNSPMLEFFSNNYAAAGNQAYTGYGTNKLKDQDPSVWSAVSNIFNQPGSDYARVLITPGMVTNQSKSYIGMGALIISETQLGA